MADEDRLVLAEFPDQADDVAGKVEQRVRGDVLGLVAAAVAALVESDDAVSGRRSGVN